MPAIRTTIARDLLLIGGVAMLATGSMLPAGPALADRPATIAEADGNGKVAVHVVFYADLSCTTIADMKPGAPANIEAPQRTLSLTVLLDRKEGECIERPHKIERSIDIPDRDGVLSVDIFYIDDKGTFVRSQRPRIYRD